MDMKKNSKDKQELTRRQFLERLGFSSAVALSLMTIGPLQVMASPRTAMGALGDDAPEALKMTYRTQNGTGEKISLLGFGMMRLPREQEKVNELVDYALAHGINYFDTAPMYGGGSNETATGLALSRHPRDKYYVATKMSNQNESLWSFEKSKITSTTTFSIASVAAAWTISGGGSSTTDSWTSCLKNARPVASVTSASAIMEM